MNRFPTPRWTALVAVLALGALAALTGCAKKVTTVDAGFTTLEGRHDPNARLFVWMDTPDSVTLYTDRGPAGPASNPNLEVDTILSITPNFNSGPGTIQALLIDGTGANGFQFFRHAGNGGLEAVTDYTIQPSVRWLSSGWEAYSLSDRTPSAYSPPTYIARGLLGGLVVTQSPLTSPVLVNPVKPKQTMRLTSDATPTDSLFDIAWTPVTGAAGYWIHVYQWKSSATVDEKRRSGTPSPVWPGNVKHFFVGYVGGGSTTSYKLGTPGAQVFEAATPLRGQTYYVRVTAVDASGNVLAWMKGDRELVMGTGTYSYFPLAATAVSPHK